MINVDTFDFKGFTLRTIAIDGAAWFVAADVCKALGLRNVTMALSTAQNIKNSEVRNHRITGTVGRANKIVSESGLYKVLFQSRKPEAREFQDWVTHAVLPAIRKDGGYVLDEEKVETEEDVMALSLRAMEMLRKKLDDKTKELGIVSDMITTVQRTLSHVCRQLEGVNTMATKRDLTSLGYLYKLNGRNAQYRVRSRYRHLFQERISIHAGRNQCEITVTAAGLKKLAALRASGSLTMKKGYTLPDQPAQGSLTLN